MLLKIGVYLQSNIFNEQTVDGLVDSESDPRAAEKKTAGRSGPWLRTYRQIMADECEEHVRF